MTQNEEKVDSDQPDGKTAILEHEYTKLVFHHFRLRRALSADFKWFRDQMKLARESSHSNRTNIINGVLEYLDGTVIELDKAMKHLEDQLDEKIVVKLRELTANDTTGGLPRKKPMARLDSPFPLKCSHPKA